MLRTITHRLLPPRPVRSFSTSTSSSRSGGAQSAVYAVAIVGAGGVALYSQTLGRHLELESETSRAGNVEGSGAKDPEVFLCVLAKPSSCTTQLTKLL